MPRLLSAPRKDPVPIIQEAGWAMGPVWTGAENLARTGIQSPDRPARSQSQHRLSYPAGLRDKYSEKLAYVQETFKFLTCYAVLTSE
jgi:hypothetical protein